MSSTPTMEEARAFWDQINLGIIDTEQTDQGLLLKKLNKFGAMAKAGIANGDLIQTINGKSAIGFNFAQQMEPLIAAGVGGTVTYGMSRGDRRYEVDVVLKKRRTLAFDIAEVDADLERKIAP